MKLPSLVLLIVAGLYLAGCEQKPERPAPKEEQRSELGQPGINPAEASGIYRVRLTARKVAEYHIQTAPVREAPAGKVVPKSAVLLDHAGAAWIFTNPQSQLFIRQPISIKSMDGGLAVLSEGPPVGAEVVIVGADKLLGLGSE